MSGSPLDATAINPLRAGINTRRLTVLYCIALSLIGLLAIIGQLSVQQALHQLQNDSSLVNMAGRQRMLSQRIPLLIVQGWLAEDASREGATSEVQDTGAHETEETAGRSRPELAQLLERWRANHLTLQRGQDESGERIPMSATMQALFAEISPSFTRLEGLARRYADDSGKVGAPDERRSDWQQMTRASAEFVQRMDGLVGQYESEARQRVERLRWTERGLLVATLLVLLGEGILIFYPAVSSFRSTFQELQETTAALSTAKAMAEEANQSKSRFLRRLSHELRTPLHASLGTLGLLRRQPMAAPHRRQLRIAHHATRALRSMVDDLLDMARIESGALAVQPQPFSVRRLMRSLSELLEPRARKKGLSWTLTIDPAVPRWIEQDEVRLRQILTNLLQNAIRYTAQGGIQLRLKVNVATAAHDLVSSSDVPTLLFEVIDTGCGIAADQAASIFEPFHRLFPTRREEDFGPGLGLGLSIARSLTESLGGRLLLESQPGQGSRFSVELPSPIATPPRRERSRSRLRRTTGPSSTDRRALVVDDASTNRWLMRRYLKHLGWKAVCVSTLEAALHAIARQDFSLVLVDLHLGDGNGWDWLVERSRDWSKSPQLPRPYGFLITADVHFKPVDMPPGIHRLSKPIEFSELRRVLGDLDWSAWSRPIASPQPSETELDVEGIRRILQRDLVSRLPQEIEGLAVACNCGDKKAAGLIIHRLFGSAGTAGLDDLARIAHDLQQALDAGGPLELDALERYVRAPR